MQKNKIEDITKEIKELENEKNIGNIMKKYNKINGDIKTLNTEILNLKKEFEEMSDTEGAEISDETFEKYNGEISDEKINNIINDKNLKSQIDEYKKIILKINSCKKFLESKKMSITECDKKQTIDTKNKNKKKSKIVYSSETSTSSSSDSE